MEKAAMNIYWAVDVGWGRTEVHSDAVSSRHASPILSGPFDTYTEAWAWVDEYRPNPPKIDRVKS